MSNPGFFSSAGDLGSGASAPNPSDTPKAPIPKVPTPNGMPGAASVPHVSPHTPAAPYTPGATPYTSAPVNVPPVNVPPVNVPPVNVPPVYAPPVNTPPAPAGIPPVYNGPVNTPPVAAPAPPSIAKKTAVRAKPSDRISVGEELKLLLRQGILVLLGERRNLIISLLFPFIAALITVWIAGEDMFVTSEATKSACFILVCASIWGGLFNSIQSLVKERENIKRDYVSGALRIECYMGSRAIIQFVLCLVQSFVLALSIPMVEAVHDNSAPSTGLFGLPVLIEVYLSLFLIMYASDALGLLISSFVKKEELASKLAPYILIAQLLFSGVLFKMEGAADIFSMIMISRWGMEALGSIFDLNNITSKGYGVVAEKYSSECVCGMPETLRLPEKEDMFRAEAGHLALVLFIMLLFVVVPLVVGNFCLHKVKDDGRE